ncbi:PSP1 domain-containing protein [Phosphitispora sp. TUW77]|uniref:PSP1 domain-containing protein n=1 Tax=Phosphitispora sp. TUW77 TaxID=3152361 RepID=UPI003AB3CCFC
MIRVVGIRFKPAGKIYYFDPNDIDLIIDDKVILETTRGIESGLVVVEPKMVEEEKIIAPLKKIIRKATPVDLKQIEINKNKGKEAYKLCVAKIEEHGLPMKLVDVEFTFDANKIIFYFTADGRIDFRDLVKDLAAIFRTRIELRQIGVRDEAKMLGGLGTCGRGLCCATFLGEFDPVSIKMAKEQNLSLNPTKISGICGRLMCCLKYESEAYETEKAAFPPEGTLVVTPVGEGKVVSVNILKKNLMVEMKESKQLVEFPPDELKICPKEKCIEKKEKKDKKTQKKSRNHESEEKGEDL